MSGDSTSLREILVNARRRAQLSLRRIADSIGVSYTYVWMWETGKKNPPTALLDRAAQAYKLTDKEKIKIAKLFVDKRIVGSPAYKEGMVLSEFQVLSAWMGLSKESRKRLLRMMEAYEQDSS